MGVPLGIDTGLVMEYVNVYPLSDKEPLPIPAQLNEYYVKLTQRGDEDKHTLFNTRTRINS